MGFDQSERAQGPLYIIRCNNYFEGYLHKVRLVITDALILTCTIGLYSSVILFSNFVS